MSPSSAAILMTAALFLGMGVYGLAAPAMLIQPFGVGLSGSDARTEVRAVYGGFGIAMAVVLTVATVNPGDVATGSVTAVASALLGMAGGRLLARLIETPSAFYPSWFYFWVELVGGGVLLGAVWA